MAALAGLIAHGGTAGLIVEIVVAVGVIALAAAAWVGARKEDDDDPGDHPPS